MKIITVIGARPQFIKAAPFSKEFRKKHKEVLLHTKQHYDKNMSELFFGELEIPEPDYNLAIPSGNHGKQTAKMLEGIEEILTKEKPDGLLVYGDTNSTLAGALAASKLQIPICHVEAGLRSHNKLMPEEQNRTITDHLSNLLLCPTQTAVDNLKKEGIEQGVMLTGDIMYDAYLTFSEIANKTYTENTNKLVPLNHLLIDYFCKNYYLATIHRAENADDNDKLSQIFEAFNELDMPVLFPIHPRTQKILETSHFSLKNISLIEPVGYLLMLYLTQNAKMVITDSGGLQKEAYFSKTPCTTVRDETEWPETLKNGMNQLCSANKEQIIVQAGREIKHATVDTSVFGNGNSAIKICNAIERSLAK